MIYGFLVSKHETQYVERFKEKVFVQFVKSLYPTVSYTSNQFVSSEKFRQSKLFGSYDRYYGEDFFNGISDNGLEFQFSEIRATETTTDSDGDSRTTTIFDGIFFVLQRSNFVSDPILILPDVAEKSLGLFGKFLQKSIGSWLRKSGNMIYLNEHPEFEKEFVIYSNNEREVERVLSPAILDTIYTLRFRYNNYLRLSFIEDTLFIGLSSTKNFFHPNINKTLLDDNQLNELYDELSMCFSIIEEINNPIIRKDKKEGNDQPVKYKKSKKDKDNPFLL